MLILKIYYIIKYYTIAKIFYFPDWQAKAYQSVDLYFAKQNINLLSLKGQD